MRAMASISDNLNPPTPTSQVQVLNINWFQKQPNGNDEVPALSIELQNPPPLAPLIVLHKEIVELQKHLSLKQASLHHVHNQEVL
ncbi:unnamed protein product [Prunus armeniaca]|uniref:Uncharacterized protein n=1 Tax=Prunus armeniaca TaxID=36596 RepID=A0A6J5WG01_PRUAR|nr:unnamed protein product [Prunus armeniaca]